VTAFIGYLLDTSNVTRARLEVERAAIRAEARRRGGAVAFVRDVGARPADERPGLIEARRLLAAGQADGLIVARIDAVTYRRAALPIVRLLAEAEEHGWQLVALDRPAEQVRDNYRREQARRPGRRQRRSIGPATEARILAEHRDGRSFSAIAAGLNRDGVPTAVAGSRWWQSTVGQVVRTRGEAGE
jgi:hypothetical protein